MHSFLEEDRIDKEREEEELKWMREEEEDASNHLSVRCSRTSPNTPRSAGKKKFSLSKAQE